jgi:serine/threonine protein kinase
MFLVISYLLTFLQVRVLATLDHPNIISYYDSFEREGILMIGTEYLNDGKLQRQYTENLKQIFPEMKLCGLSPNPVPTFMFL